MNGFPESGGGTRISVDGGTEPIWSPNGSELFYRSATALMVAEVEKMPDFRVRSRATLFEGPYEPWIFHSNYDIHPDGDRFVMIKPVEEASARFVVVLNWFEELRQRMGNEIMSTTARLSTAPADGYKIEREPGAGRLTTAKAAARQSVAQATEMRGRLGDSQLAEP